MRSKFHRDALNNPDLAAKVADELAQEPNSNSIVHSISDENDVNKNQYLCLKCNVLVTGIQKVKDHCGSKISHEYICDCSLVPCVSVSSNKIRDIYNTKSVLGSQF